MKKNRTYEIVKKENILRTAFENPRKIFQGMLIVLCLWLPPKVYSQTGPYTPDANTIVLDHFDGSTSASILAYNGEQVTPCTQQPSATPSYSYTSGPNGFTQALILNSPAGQPAGSATYLQYPNGQILSVPNGSIEFYVYLTSYGNGLGRFVSQGQYYWSCGGWTFDISVDSTGRVSSEAWAAFNMNSGTTKLRLNTWTHVAATWGSAGAKLYLDGVLVGSDANTGMPASGYGGSLLMTLGTNSGASAWIDELRVSDIQRTYTPSLPAPTLLYPSDSTSGIAPTDSVRWTPVIGATSYYIQIGTNSAMTAGYTVMDTVTNPVHWIGSTTPNEQLYWHVKALDGRGGSSLYSAIWGFTVGSGTGPSLSATPNSLDFGYVQTITTSMDKMYSVYGSNLTSNGSITINAPTGFEISRSSGSGYTTSLTIPYTGNTLSPTSIIVRFVPASAVSYNANVTHSGGGVASYRVLVSGIGNIAPGTPTGLIATPGDGQVTLTWNKNTEADLLRYRIYSNIFPVTPILADSIERGILDTTRIMTGLTNGTLYYFSVTAVDSGGLESGHGTEQVTTPSAVADVIPPGSPINPTTPGGWVSRTVSLSWTNPFDSSGIATLWYTFDSPPSISNLGTSINIGGSTTAYIPTPASYTSGTYTLYFYLADGAGNKDYTTAVSVTFQCDNQPPVIYGVNVVNTPVTVNNTGTLMSNSPQINATASDGGSGIREMKIAYRSCTETAWTYFSSLTTVGNINFTLPQSPNKFSYLGKPVGVNFRVGAVDNAGNETWSLYNSIDVQLGSQITDQPNFSMPPASQTNNKATAYRMISVPYDLGPTNQQPFKILDNFGPHMDNNISYARWRFQRYVNGQYQDYDQFSQMNVVVPGAAFFFIIRDQGAQIIVQGASIVRSDTMLTRGIQLQSGWNLVGNPFTFPYPIDSLIFLTGTIRQRASYAGIGPIGGWDTSSASVQFIQPWQGVALYVNNPGILRFPSLGMRGLPKVNPVVSVPVIERENAENWTLSVNAYRSDINMRSEGSSLGMAHGASEGDDLYDSYIPPIVGDQNVAVYFKNADGAMMRDIRPPNENGGVWDMRVVTGDAGVRVKLQLGNKLNLPNPVFEAYLIDLDQKMAHNLKEIQSLEINSGTGVRNFQVVVGKKSFVAQNNAGVELTPSAVKLFANYPNPFNPETVIRYSIPNTSASYAVTLKVFNVLGQEIAALVNEQKSAGYYEVKWNALQQSSGVGYASGVYFYQLSASDGTKTFQEIKKMILMK